jgi:pyruvate/2-oxoglutarate dehydrogenase complex dihydrolipoamide acyltransferase (E2) component
MHSRQAGIPAPGKFLTTPAVRKIAKEHGLDLAQVRASGPKGRIVKEDVLAFIAGKQTQTQTQQQPAPSSSAQASASSAAGSSASAASAAKAAAQKGDQRVPIRGIQRLMVKSMTDSLQVRPSLHAP